MTPGPDSAHQLGVAFAPNPSGSWIAGLVWLVAHDLRLSWRRFAGMFRNMSGRRAGLIVGAAVACFHLLAWPAARWMANRDASGDMLYPAVAAGLAMVLPWIISSALTNTTRALYTRGDLDLLQASPLDPRTVFAAKAFSIAVESMMATAVFILPVANMNALIGGAHWLAVYPALAAAGFAGTAVGLVATTVLAAFIGPRRMRLVAQVVATLVGAGFALGLQAINIVSPETRGWLYDMAAHPPAGSMFDHGGWLWLPVRAFAGEIDALLLWSALSILLFLVVALGLGARLGRAAILAAGAPQAEPKRQAARAARRFRAGVGPSLRRKEWRLLARDPWLLSQVLLQIIYTAPVSVVIWKSLGPQGSLSLAIAPALVVVSSQVAASLAWLAVSSEDAPDFLASAPVTAVAVERRKLEAVALPVGLFIAVPLAGMAVAAPDIAAWTLAFCVAASASTAFLNFWHPAPGKRGDVMRRHAQSKLVGAMEHLLALLWSLALMIALFESFWALAPITLAGAVLAANRPRRAIDGKIVAVQPTGITSTATSMR